MSSLSDQLRAIAAQLDATFVATPATPATPDAPTPPPTVLGPPAQHVAVYPTGPRGQGKVRFYPDPAAVTAYDGGPVQTLSGYASQIQEKWASPHFDFRRLGGMLFGGFAPVSGPADFPAALDKLAYPDDWKSQETLDYEAKLKARDAQIGATWSPR